jgi:hypothetical protein
MAGNRRRVNPFYVLLVLVGVGFVLTTCAYTVMIVSADQMARSTELAPRKSWLLAFMDVHGGKLILWELLALGVTTVAAISTDRFWAR